MTSVGDFDDPGVQNWARLYAHENLVDIVMETTEVKDVVECIQKPGSNTVLFETLSKSTSNQVLLCFQGVRQVGVEDCMELVMQIVALLLEHVAKESEEVKLLEKRVQRVKALVESVTNQLIEATGIYGESERYERAKTKWITEVERWAEHQSLADVSDSLGRGPFLLLTGVRPNTNALTSVAQV